MTGMMGRLPRSPNYGGKIALECVKEKAEDSKILATQPYPRMSRVAVPRLGTMLR